MSIQLTWNFNLGPKHSGYVKRAIINKRPTILCKITGEKCADTYEPEHVEYKRSCRNCKVGLEHYRKGRQQP